MIKTKVFHRKRTMNPTNSSFLEGFVTELPRTECDLKKSNGNTLPKLTSITHIMDNAILQKLETHTHLILIFSQDCGMQDHIEEIVKRA